MSKLLLMLSMCGLVVLLAFGIAIPDSPVMWLASASTGFAVLRGFVLLILLVLLVSEPPRNLYFRAFVGMLSIGLLGWTISATYQNHMQFLDTMSLIQASISAGLIVWERQPSKEKLLSQGYEISSVRRLQLARQ